MSEAREYTFEVKLCATLTVKATNRLAAKSAAAMTIEQLELSAPAQHTLNADLARRGIEVLSASVAVDNVDGPQLMLIDGDWVDDEPAAA